MERPTSLDTGSGDSFKLQKRKQERDLKTFCLWDKVGGGDDATLTSPQAGLFKVRFTNIFQRKSFLSLTMKYLN